MRRLAKRAPRCPHNARKTNDPKGENMKPKSPPDIDAAVLEKIAAMPKPFSAMGKRVHAIILRSAPELQPRLWYGMPAYAKEGKTVCFFRADKNYMTFGFTQEAGLAPEKGAPHQ